MILFVTGIYLPQTLQAISVEQSLDKSSIAFEDSVSFEILIEWEGPQQAYYFGRPLDPYFDRLKVGGFSSSIKSEGVAGNEITTKRFRYVLLPTSSGAAKIDAITISYTAMPDSVPGELVTEPMAVTVAEAIPIDVDGGFPALYYYLMGLVIVLIAGFGFFKWNMSRQAIEPRKSPRELFLIKLDDLKQSAGQDFKKFQYGLSDMLEDYLQAEYSFPVRNCSDDEIVDEINKTTLSEKDKERLSGWFLAARRDKFRPVDSGPGETIRLENEIREFFK